MVTAPTRPTPRTELSTLGWLIQWIESQCLPRESTTEGERQAQEFLAAELESRGLPIERHAFRYSRSLYAVIALHCAVATAAAAFYLWMPYVGAALHVLAVVSYLLDCHYRGFLLRRLLPFRPSQNILATMPSEGPPRLRVVYAAHADAAPTGWMFHPALLHKMHKKLPDWLWPLRKHMLHFTLAMTVLVGLEVLIATTGYWFPGWYYGLTLGALIPLVLMLQIVITNRTVPGANDNLTGCAALVALADRLAVSKPADVEVVLAVTGCEESGRGGAWALARDMRGTWDPKITKVIALDTLSGGPLRYHVEGEVVPIWFSRELRETLEETARNDSRFGGIAPYHAPAGATDAAPFLLLGFDAACITRIDPKSDLPMNYHVPDDFAANLNMEQVRDAVAYAEQVLLNLASKAVD